MLNGDVQQSVGQRRVGARRELQMQRRQLGGGRSARIDDDQLAAAPALLLEILHDRRHGLGRIAADQQDRLRAGDILERKRQPAIEAEGAQICGRRRCHAEAAVVVDIGGAQRDPRELAEHVGLLVGQPAAAKHPDRVAAV